MTNAALQLAEIFEELREAQPRPGNPTWGRKLDTVANARGLDRQSLLSKMAKYAYETEKYIDELEALGNQVDHFRSGARRWEEALFRPKGFGSTPNNLNAEQVIDASTLDLLRALGYTYSRSPVLDNGADTAHIKDTLAAILDFISTIDPNGALSLQMAMKVTRVNTLLDERPLNSHAVFDALCGVIGLLHILIERSSRNEEEKKARQSEAAKFTTGLFRDFGVQSGISLLIEGAKLLITGG